MNEPLINILIRTCNRPSYFKRCYESIQNQTYKNIKVIVSSDQAVSYIPEDVETINVCPDRKHPFFWNLYCNSLKQQVKDGWFFYLDDDDFLANTKALENISIYLRDPHTAVICQFLRWNVLKPDGYELHQKIIKQGRIGMPCIFLHHSQKNKVDFDGRQAADYRFILKISQLLPTKFVPVVVVKTDRIGNGKY